MNNKSVGSAFFDLRDICEEVKSRLVRKLIREAIGEAIEQSAYLVEDSDKENELVDEYCSWILQVTRVTEDVTQQIRNYCKKDFVNAVYDDMRDSVKQEHIKDIDGETEPVELAF